MNEHFMSTQLAIISTLAEYAVFMYIVLPHLMAVLIAVYEHSSITFHNMTIALFPRRREKLLTHDRLGFSTGCQIKLIHTDILDGISTENKNFKIISIVVFRVSESKDYMTR